MAAVIISYRLNPGVTPADFEQWVKTVDQPTMRGMARVTAFDTFRVERLLMGEGEPSAAYVEVFDIPDLDGFMTEEMAGAAMQGIMEQFAGFAAAPEFLVATKL
jgi:hypothetical protein